MADSEDVRLGFRFDARDERWMSGVLAATELEVLPDENPELVLRRQSSASVNTKANERRTQRS